MNFEERLKECVGKRVRLVIAGAGAESGILHAINGDWAEVRDAGTPSANVVIRLSDVSSFHLAEG